MVTERGGQDILVSDEVQILPQQFRFAGGNGVLGVVIFLTIGVILTFPLAA